MQDLNELKHVFFFICAEFEVKNISKQKKTILKRV